MAVNKTKVSSNIELVGEKNRHLTLCHASEFQNILDSNYTRINMNVVPRSTMNTNGGTEN